MNFLVDYLGCILLRAITVFLTLLPAEVALYIGRIIGVIGYYIDRPHRNIVYNNLKIAFSQEKTPEELKLITRRLYQNFSQNISELLRLPAVNTNYLKQYITIEGEEYLQEALKEKKGLIFLAVHFGSWEVSNVLGAMFGYSYSVIAKEQKRFKRLNALLTSYRQITGAYVVHKGWGTRDIIESLQNNEVVGMVADQGGKNGVFVDFFGRPASMSGGAIRIALRLGVKVLPVFLIRKKGPYHLLKINPPLDLKESDDSDENIRINLVKVIQTAEEVIRQYPDQYMWFYKVWKYSPQRDIVILNDGKAGHLRQSETVAKILEEQLKKRNLVTITRWLEVRFKNNLAKKALSLSGILSEDILCHGCLKCLRYLLAEETYKNICRIKANFIVSCGSSLAPLNAILSAETQAKSICILKPGMQGIGRFDLVIMPKHDKPRAKKNVFITRGAPNLINDSYLKEKKEGLLKQYPGLDSAKVKIGILIGGNTKTIKINKEALKEALVAIRNKAEALDMEILVTTSRRTAGEIEDLVTEIFSNYPHCQLQIIANRKNIPEAVGGILALSNILVVTEDSISMISEAASSGKNVIVLRYEDKDGLELSDRHDRFLKELSDNKNIILTDTVAISRKIEDMAKGNLRTSRLNDWEIIVRAVNSVI